MFIFLNRMLVIGLVVACVVVMVGIGYQVWEHRSVFEPVLSAYENGPVDPQDQPKPVATISGRVTSVTSGDSFILVDIAGNLHRFGMTGILAPTAPRKAPKVVVDRALTSSNNLAKLILSNTVVVNVTYMGSKAEGHGTVFLNGTNINVVLVEQGMADVKPEFLKSLPFSERYALLKSQQRAREAGIGIWK